MTTDDWLGLRDRPALVVGAGGLGAAAALSLAAHGARVAIIDRDTERLQAAADSAGQAGARVQTVVADVGSPDACRAAVQAAIDAVGTPAVFLHAIGSNQRRPVLELGDEEWQSMVTLNLSTAWWLGQAVGRQMVAAGYGRMAFVSSVSALLAHANHAPYAATKGGINQMMRVMAREWAPFGVTVNSVGPGYIETDLTRDYLNRGNHRQELVSMIPAQRLGQPEEVADALTFLLSPRAGFITGQCLYIDGGRTLV